MSAVVDQLNLVVRDMDATLEFYRAAGLDIPDDAVWRTDSGAHHVEIEMPGGFALSFDSVALAQVYNGGWREPNETASRSIVGLRLGSRDAVDRTCAVLANLGHGVSQPPYDTFWGSRYAVVVDPDGNNVGLMSPPDPGRRSAPPAL